VAKDKNYLFQEMITQIHRQPLRWQHMVIVGQPGDPINDASLPCPPDREQVDVGTFAPVESDDTSAATAFVPPHLCHLGP
jgi:catalase